MAYTSKHKAFYNSSAWLEVRALKLALNPLCEYGPHHTVTVATDVDHVISIEVAPHLRLDITNLRSACHACHSSKTRTMDNPRQGGTAKRRRIKGSDRDGHPLDPNHHWNVGKSS
jgi:5-methylcytosine-specific restriction endonuclease McrA